MFYICQVLLICVVKLCYNAVTYSMSDEEFLGVWDNTAGQWATVGKINYDYSVALKKVEELVQKGEYENAKAALKEYHVNVTAADLIGENIFNVGSKEIYLTTFAMDGSEYRDYIIDVTDVISASKDTTVSAGVYSNTNYGDEPLLFVRDSGAPVDDNTSRSYIHGRALRVEMTGVFQLELI
jgi:hypothetical protein